ncbi:MAG TPA: hypothetical protein VNX46_05815, partial [Candidatus Acidoferrum sp.]|nr:hypothetical protein [Candidatus Acidoferrum sp.]
INCSVNSIRIQPTTSTVCPLNRQKKHAWAGTLPEGLAKGQLKSGDDLPATRPQSVWFQHCQRPQGTLKSLFHGGIQSPI